MLKVRRYMQSEPHYSLEVGGDTLAVCSDNSSVERYSRTAS